MVGKNKNHVNHVIIRRTCVMTISKIYAAIDMHCAI